MRPLLILLPLALAPPAAAQDPATDPACANVRVALPAELAGWSDQMPVTAGVKPGDGATILLGQSARVALHPAKHLTFAQNGRVGSGGTLAMMVTAPGTYRIALGGRAWVDLLQDGKAVTSGAHSHGPKCSGVRKLIDFRLQPGTYTIQLSGSDTDNVTLLVAKLA